MKRKRRNGHMIEYDCTIRGFEVWKVVESVYRKNCMIIAVNGDTLNYIFNTKRFDKGYYVLDPKEDWKPCMTTMETE